MSALDEGSGGETFHGALDRIQRASAAICNRGLADTSDAELVGEIRKVEEDQPIDGRSSILVECPG